MIIQPHKIKFEIFDKFGNLEFKKEQLMKSFLSNWVLYQRGGMATASPTLKDTTGVNRVYNIAYFLRMDAPEANVTYGIRVGTSSQAVAIADNALIGAIAHGSGDGQLYHKITTISAVTVGGSSAYFTVQRNMDNNSGNTINIEEVGLIGDDFSTANYFLLARDLTGTIAVATAKTFVATYTYTASV